VPDHGFACTASGFADGPATRRTAGSSSTTAPANCALYSRAYAPSYSSSCSWLPCWTMRPASITRMRSASRMVERRCAITKLVRSVRSAAIACCTSTSVLVSTEEVASSRISSDGSARNALAMVISCFSPALTLLPSKLMTVS